MKTVYWKNMEKYEIISQYYIEGDDCRLVINDGFIYLHNSNFKLIYKLAINYKTKTIKLKLHKYKWNSMLLPEGHNYGIIPVNDNKWIIIDGFNDVGFNFLSISDNIISKMKLDYEGGDIITYKNQHENCLVGRKCYNSDIKAYPIFSVGPLTFLIINDTRS